MRVDDEDHALGVSERAQVYDVGLDRFPARSASLDATLTALRRGDHCIAVRSQLSVEHSDIVEQSVRRAVDQPQRGEERYYCFPRHVKQCHAVIVLVAMIYRPLK